MSDTPRRSSVPPLPTVPLAPRTYDAKAFDNIIRELQTALTRLIAARPIATTGFDTNGFPENGGTLLPGQVFINENGLLQVVRPGDIFVAPLSATGEIGTVTVLTP